MRARRVSSLPAACPCRQGPIDDRVPETLTGPARPPERGSLSPAMAHRIHLTLAFALLAIALTLLSLHFFDWPPNRDLTTYATIARELRQGETL